MAVHAKEDRPSKSEGASAGWHNEPQNLRGSHERTSQAGHGAGPWHHGGFDMTTTKRNLEMALVFLFHVTTKKNKLLQSNHLHALFHACTCTRRNQQLTSQPPGISMPKLPSFACASTEPMRLPVASACNLERRHDNDMHPSSTMSHPRNNNIAPSTQQRVCVTNTATATTITTTNHEHNSNSNKSSSQEGPITCPILFGMRIW